MATQLQLRRGTTSETGSFTGAVGEVTVDTTKDTLVVHDGSTAGGHEVAKADGSNIEKLTKSGATKIATTSGGISVTGDISNASGDLTLDVAGDIILDADGGDVIFKDGGAEFGSVGNSSGSLFIEGLPSAGKVGLTFFGSSIEPRDNGSSSNGAVDLGSTGARFKDIHLSGAVNAASLDISGDIDVDGTTNLDVVDIDGAVDMASTLIVGGTTRINSELQLTAASGKDRFTIAPQAAGSGTFLISFNEAANGYEPVVFDFENLNLRTSGVSRFNITPNEIVANDLGTTQDFRVESDGNDHMLFVDGGQNHVNIGTATDLAGVLNVDGNISLSGAGTGGRSILLGGETASYAGILRIQAGGISSGFGGGIALYGHSHASKPGDVVLGISGGSGGSFRVNSDGVDTGTDRLEVTDTGAFTTTPAAGNHAVFNEGGIDADFRVESDNLENALFINGADGKVTMQGATTIIGSAASSTNVEFNMNGVASKATRIQFQEGGANKWLLGQGAASETSAFELFNAVGTIALSVDRSTNVVTFAAGASFTDGNLKVASGHGIDFSATSGSGTSELLDDYEEGTWTAQVKYGGVSGTAATLSEAGGSYTKIGRQVTVNFEIDVSNTNSGSGLVNITGLPFTIADIITPTGLEASGSVVYFGGFSTGVNSLGIAADSSGALILYGLTNSTQTGVSVITASIMGTGEIRGSVSYFTNQ